MAGRRRLERISIIVGDRVTSDHAIRRVDHPVHKESSVSFVSDMRVLIRHGHEQALPWSSEALNGIEFATLVVGSVERHRVCVEQILGTRRNQSLREN